MTTITHNGRTAKTTARVGDIITKRQAISIITRLGAKREPIATRFEDGHEVYHAIGGSDNCWMLLRPPIRFAGPEDACWNQHMPVAAVALVVEE